MAAMALAGPNSHASSFYPTGKSILLGGTENERHLSAELQVALKNPGANLLTRCTFGSMWGFDFEIARRFTSSSDVPSLYDFAIEIPVRFEGPESWMMAPVLGWARIEGKTVFPWGVQARAALSRIGMWGNAESWLGADAPTARLRLQVETLLRSTPRVYSFIGVLTDVRLVAGQSSQTRFSFVTGTRF